MGIKVKSIDLKLARVKSGIRQYDLAARLGISPSRLSEIESGRRKPSEEIIERFFQIISKK